MCNSITVHSAIHISASFGKCASLSIYVKVDFPCLYSKVIAIGFRS